MSMLRRSCVAIVLVLASTMSSYAGLPLSINMRELATAETLSRVSCGRFAVERENNWKLPGCVLEVRRRIGLATVTLEPMMAGQPIVRDSMNVYLDCIDKYLKELPRVGHEADEAWQARYQRNLAELDEAHENLAAALSRFLRISF
jgi:hypothetical protein